MDREDLNYIKSGKLICTDYEQIEESEQITEDESNMFLDGGEELETPYILV